MSLSGLIYAKSEQCIGSVHIQHRGGVVYLPNHAEPYTGGYYCSYPANGQYEYKGNFLDGKMDGLWTFWYENGQKSRQIQLKNDKEDGYFINWYENEQQT